MTPVFAIYLNTAAQAGDTITLSLGALGVSYEGSDANASSNSFALNLQDTGEIARTYTGDKRAKLIGIEIDLNSTADKPSFDTYKWSATSWVTDGTLNGGIAQADFADVIYASCGNDKIDGRGGKDALSGGAGNNVINGEGGSRYKNSSCSRIPVLARRPIRSKGRPIQRWRRLSTVQTGVYRSAAI